MRIKDLTECEQPENDVWQSTKYVIASGETIRDRVLSQIEYITNLLKERDFYTAKKIIDELVDYQLANSDLVQTVSSLCSLAQNAKKLGLDRFQLELTKRAVDLKQDDAWSQAQYGNALLGIGRFDEAIVAFQYALSFSVGDRNTVFVAKNGQAEVLKSQGKFDEALEIYREAIKAYPENAVAYSGRSGVLFALGEYDRALEKLDEEELLRTFNWVGYHIRGMIMLRIGELEEAMRIFKYGIENDPTQSSKEYFRSALVVAKLAQGNIPEAKVLLEEINGIEIQPKANILRMHVYGESKEFEIVRNAYKEYEQSRKNIVLVGPWAKNEQSLVSELENRYISRNQPNESNKQIFDREIQLLAA